MRISDWSSDVCSSDLVEADLGQRLGLEAVLRVPGVERAGFLAALLDLGAIESLRPGAAGAAVEHRARRRGEHNLATLDAVVDALDQHARAGVDADHDVQGVVGRVEVEAIAKNGRAHVRTTVTNTQPVCR